MNAITEFEGKNITPFEEAKLAIDDLFEEAEVWLTGEGVASAAEADAVEKLLDLARSAKKTADEARKVENEPFDTGKAEVQARYNPILKRADMITDTCKKVLQPWRDKIAAEKAAQAEQARKEADEIRRKAEEAIRASSGNITARAEAEQLLASAKIAEKDAKRVEKSAVTGNGLRTTYRADLSDLSAAIKHYWSTKRPQFEALVCDMAAADVRNGVRQIPGFTVIEERKAI
jgi:small-conductance mechanosensitive channel